MIRWVAHAAVVWAIFNAVPPDPPDPPGPIRLVEKPCLHIGVRPSTDGSGMAVSLQISTCWL